ncbi:hypothetical protein [Escherichia phage Lidtsur]|uniref:Uncharacterized protein n=1 Tax=Escherichia phage Lidtsur TaxID=2562235 RepID=A0A4D6E0S1_9CAUD|nr:hypothetical protein HOV34_gp55 [Escherichia phage Lidtsur]QBZ71559.1 hypothetical protein [Escherichia phage Lidtsur]
MACCALRGAVPLLAVPLLPLDAPALACAGIGSGRGGYLSLLPACCACVLSLPASACYLPALACLQLLQLIASLLLAVASRDTCYPFAFSRYPLRVQLAPLRAPLPHCVLRRLRCVSLTAYTVTVTFIYSLIYKEF